MIAMPAELNSNLTNIKISVDGKLQQTVKKRREDGNWLYKVEINVNKG